MAELLSQFHLLRPLWLLAIIPALCLGIFLFLQKRNSANWRQIIAPQLLNYLLENQITHKTRWQLFTLVFAWVFTCFALAGPTWKQISQLVHKNEAAVVIVWDLSPSVVAEDLKPSRLVRARHKLTDLLNARQEGLTALVAFAGEAYVVSPLTDDTDTIINLLPALHPDIMPLPGSNVEMGVEKALQLLQDSNNSQGDILVVTDGITYPAQETLKELLSNTQYRLSIFGVGTADGAPIPTSNGGFAKDQYGSIVIAKMNTVELRQLAQSLDGHYVGIQANDSDVEFLVNATEQTIPEQELTQASERTFDSWFDVGQFLALLLLPFIILAFRRGWILPALFAIVIWPQPSEAFGWQDLWSRKDQRAQQSFEAGNHEEASQTFQSKPWQGSAHYRNENFSEAANAFNTALESETNPLELANTHYNHGNALAKAGDFQGALDAYEQALSADAKMEDAQFNSELIKSLLEQQQKNNEDGQNSDDNQDSDGDSGPNNSDQANNEQNSQQGEQQDADNQQAQNDQQQDGEQDDSNQANSEQSSQEEQKRNADDSDNQDKGEQSAQDLAEQESQEQSEKQQLSQAEQREEHEPLSEEQASLLADSELSGEKQQAMEQWLRQIPDDPSGLLRNKFKHQHQMLRRRYQNGEWAPPENGANLRW